MVIIQCIVNGFAVAAEPHKLGVLEHPKLVAHRRLAQLHRIGDILHTQFIIMQCVQDLDAGGVAKHPEQVGQFVQHLVVRQDHRPGCRLRHIFLLLWHSDISLRFRYMNVCSCVHAITQIIFCQGVLQRFLRIPQNCQNKPQNARNLQF